MKRNKSSRNIISHSLLWASLMIALSIILSGTDYYQKIFPILLVVWWVTHNLLISDKENGNTVKAEIACLKRFFTFSPAQK